MYTAAFDCDMYVHYTCPPVLMWTTWLAGSSASFRLMSEVANLSSKERGTSGGVVMMKLSWVSEDITGNPSVQLELMCDFKFAEQI